MKEYKCYRCASTFALPVTDAQLKAWQKGELIQNAVPHLTADQRELLISGICGPCFDRMFPNN